jgi:hypothetical protein
LLSGTYITNENSTTRCQSPSIDAPLKDVVKQMIKPKSTESGLLIRSDVAQKLMQLKNYPTALSQEMMIRNVDLWAKEGIEHMHFSGDDIEILQLKLEDEGKHDFM